MSIPQLSEEQIRTMSVQQKDAWWLANVFRGNTPQLTLRSALTGFILGGLLSATNLYVGAKTGWSLGVGLTSVILAFATFKVLRQLGLAKDFTILENNAMQSVATAAGYMTGPLSSGIAAYMMVKNVIMPWHQMMLFNIVLSVLGVLVAFPMKRRFINDEQAPFPEGQACGVVLDTLYTSSANVGLFKAKALAVTALGAAAIKFITSEKIQEWLQHKVLRLSSDVLAIPETLDQWCYNLLALFTGKPTPHATLANVPIEQLGLAPEIDLAMVGAGGLMGIRTATNMIVGMILTWVIAVPSLISRNVVLPKSVTEGLVTYTQGELSLKLPEWPFHGPLKVQLPHSPITPELLHRGVVTYAQPDILIKWPLWPGVAMIVVASLVAFFAQPKVIMTAFRTMMPGKKTAPTDDVLRGIEFPTWISLVGVPVVGAIGVWMMAEWFDVHWYWGALSIPLIIALTLIAVNATALTSITPTGALSKITQLTFGGLNPQNPATNLMTACMTTDVSSNAANLLMDIKPGYMLGAKPRQQAVGHVIGIIAGAAASTPLFYIMFLAGHRGNPFTPLVESRADLNIHDTLVGGGFSFIAAEQWKAISDIINTGGSDLVPSAKYALVVGFVLGLIFEVYRLITKNKSPISPIGLGLGILLPPSSTMFMFLGALFFWSMSRLFAKRERSFGHSLWVDTREPLCAGLIAGWSLMGVWEAIVNGFFL